MSLDVETPPPPHLEGNANAEEYDDVDVEGDNYRRDDLQAYLEDGAWERAFEEWADDADVDEESFAVIVDLKLFERFDFFWDDFANRVGYHAPGIPEDWKRRDLHPDLDSWETVSGINAGLTELGQTVCDVLKAEYIEWESEYDPPEDVPDFEE
jgi:hypothetical protein